jgi:hypothetical protein
VNVNTELQGRVSAMVHTDARGNFAFADLPEGKYGRLPIGRPRAIDDLLADERFALASGFGARIVAIATAVAVTILAGVEFARFAATDALIAVPLMLAVVALFRIASKRPGALA